MLRFLTSLLFILCLSVSSFSQKKYQGLLWEISGNGLSNPSYLYGTMHVSNKLAFNVSDSFYYCLNQAEAIALESSPQSWMKEYRDMGSLPYNAGYGSDFYKKAFKLLEPQSDIIFDLLANKNSLINQILYRFNPGNEDYQENTYLDMFIFQAGSKNGKPIFSLESFKEVMELSVKSMQPDKDKKRDNSNNSYLESDGQRKFVMLEESYRRGDLDQIDSLSKSNNPTAVYHKYFIVERNKNMVRRMDSIMRHHTLFTGIGAAHLPGKEGAIELLRDLGYTVRAVSRKSSGKSHKMRKKLEELYREVDFTQSETTDGFIKVDVPGYFYEMPSYQRGKMEFLCPEPINGGYFSVIRQFTFGPLFKKSADYYRETFDSLDYMATPGDIIKKEDITVNGHIGYNIVSKTSKGTIINYNIFFTPLEIIVFKGSGIGDYIQRSEPQTFFSNIELIPESSEWKNVSPKFGGAKWQMKGMISGQDMIDQMDNTPVDPFYQSYDSETKDYYQVMSYQLNDLHYIEEDSFDLYFLGKRYGDQLGYDVYNTIYKHNGNYAYIEQQLKQNEETSGQVEKLNIKIITKGGSYFLMATTAQDANTRKFFDSFEYSDFAYESNYEVYEDTNLFYTVNTIINEEKIDYQAMTYGLYGSHYEEEEDKSFLSENKQKYHNYLKQNESVFVGYRKFHDFDGWDSLSQFWEGRLNILAKANGLIISRKKETEVNGDPSLTFMLTDTGSAKGVLTHFRLHHGVLYTLKSLVDTIAGPSDFVSTFFDSFNPMDTLIGRDPFEDKAEVFLKHAFGSDSLNKVNAIKSINKIPFEDKDVPGVVKLYQKYDYDEDNETIEREDFIMTLGNREVEEAYDFLYAVYDSNNFKSDLQFIVLKCFSYTETQSSYDAIKKLLLENTPFTEKNGKLSFFNNLYDSLDLAKNYFPRLLELVVYPEYKPFIVELLAYGYLSDVFTYANYKAKKDIIYRDAYIELKRTVANQEEEGSNANYYNNEYNNQFHNIFLDYYALMNGFKKNGANGTDKFFKDIYRITDKKFILEAEIIHHILGLDVDTTKINQVVNDIDFRVWAYERLQEEEMLEFFTPNISQEDMAFALLYSYGYDEEEDTVVFLKKLEVDNGKEQGYVYFFKRKTEDLKNWMIDYVGLQPLNQNKFETDYLDFKKGLSVKNEEEIELTIEKTMEIFELKNRKRVVVTSYDWGGWGGLF
jgi:uncharacterized protein YbaP (TraB family)